MSLQSNLKKLEELIDADLSNGRHFQKKLIKAIEEKGLTKEEVIEQLKAVQQCLKSA